MAEFSVSRDEDGRLVLRMESHVCDGLIDLLNRWNEDLLAQGVNRDSGWAEVADALAALREETRNEAGEL